MSSWFRVYGDLIDDPKFIRLSPDLRSALLTLWCIASKYDGRLPPMEDMAIKFRLSVGRTEKLVNELERCGFIDRDEMGTTPHNWNERQYKSDVSTERVKRFRKRHETVSETPPEQSRTETEQNRDTASAVPYAFESGIIKLSEKHLSLWTTSFSYLDVKAELLGLSDWAAQQGGRWFHAVSGALAKRNREAKLAGRKKDGLRAEPIAPEEAARLTQKYEERRRREGWL